MSLWTFKNVTEAILMPGFSLFGLVGNSISIIVLHHRDVKLKRDFIDVLCALAAFDILFLVFTFLLFSLDKWSEYYSTEVWALLMPFLFPATNTLMTASIYMTVAVAVNRYMDMRINASHLAIPRIQSGVSQSVIVLVCATLFNLPRWFEFGVAFSTVEANVTLANGSVVLTNYSVVEPIETDLRKNKDYIRDYTLIANTVCVLLLPTLIMLVSTVLIVKQMIAPKSLAFSSGQEQARKKRNRSITLMLIGIIVLFFLCHIGEVMISVYEMVSYIHEEGDHSFPDWIRDLIVVNHLLIVVNSSLNFAIYCKDLVFRQTVRKIYDGFCFNASCCGVQLSIGRSSHNNNHNRRNHNNNNHRNRQNGGTVTSGTPLGKQSPKSMITTVVGASKHSQLTTTTTTTHQPHDVGGALAKCGEVQPAAPVANESSYGSAGSNGVSSATNTESTAANPPTVISATATSPGKNLANERLGNCGETREGDNRSESPSYPPRDKDGEGRGGENGRGDLDSEEADPMTSMVRQPLLSQGDQSESRGPRDIISARV